MTCHVCKENIRFLFFGAFAKTVPATKMVFNTKAALGFSFLYLLTSVTATNTRKPIHLNLSGHIDQAQVYSFVYVPFEIEEGVTSISVVQDYALKGNGSSLDLGLFDQRGVEAPDAFGQFGTRGWSGGKRYVMISIKKGLLI
jgi:hypothetical protein